jgi:hypothetical protein
VPAARLQIDPVASTLYIPTHPCLLRELFNALPLENGPYYLIDFGSGKGRVILYASQYPFREITGIELDPVLHATAVRNIASFRGPRRCPSVRSVCMDFREFEIPSAPAVYFLYHPLRGEFMVRLLERICAAVAAAPRDAFLVYVNPEQAAAVDRSGVFRRFRVDSYSVVWRSIGQPV